MRRGGRGGARGRGFYSTIAHPPRPLPLPPTLRPPLTRVGWEDSPQANLQVVRAAANQKAPSSPRARSPVVSSSCVATGKRLTSVAVWRDLTEERRCVWIPITALCIQRAYTHTHTTHACNRVGQILDAHAGKSART